VAPLPSGNTVEGSILFIRVLSFLDEMAKDQVLNNILQSLHVYRRDFLFSGMQIRITSV